MFCKFGVGGSFESMLPEYFGPIGVGECIKGFFTKEDFRLFTEKDGALADFLYEIVSDALIMRQHNHTIHTFTLFEFVHDSNGHPSLAGSHFVIH
jgi:hypothetical protein